jgi:hydrogenase nickel incorporation protein HypA/HybF
MPLRVLFIQVYALKSTKVVCVEADPMHELSICRNIVEIVRKEIAARHVRSIDELGVRVGALSGVDPDALEFAFEIAARDTVLHGAVLTIERVPVAATCRKCGGNTSCENHTYACTTCGSADLTITQGDELEIAYIIEHDEG